MHYQAQSSALILLQDGTIFYGKSAGISGTALGEICFNTGTTGYQEIFTDPSYFGQIMVTTNAHIGNYGITLAENESDSIQIAGLVCKKFSQVASRPQANQTVLEYFQQHNKIIISDVDTRALVSYIRDNGAMNAILCTDNTPLPQLQEQLAQAPVMKGQELASKVSVTEPYYFGNPEATYKVAALDLGIKRNILRNIASRDCYIKVFPYNTTLAEMLPFQPDGFFLSNGPGDPEPLTQVQQLAQEILNNNYPLFGICLGHQLIALAHNVPTYKMFNGHRGINHPVKNLETGKGEITSQNHGFAVEKEALLAHPDLELTHIHLNDQTAAGLRVKNKPCFSVQYHPEAAPGPHDSAYLFDNFIALLQSHKK